jgi:hypothetical protein
MFKRIRNADHTRLFPDGDSLWFELYGVTNEQVRKLFGSGLANQDKCKYSTSLYIRSELTGRPYTLYKSYGVWRVGASGGMNRSGIALVHDKAALEQLFGK